MCSTFTRQVKHNLPGDAHCQLGRATNRASCQIVSLLVPPPFPSPDLDPVLVTTVPFGWDKFDKLYTCCLFHLFDVDWSVAQKQVHVRVINRRPLLCDAQKLIPAAGRVNFPEIVHTPSTSTTEGTYARESEQLRLSSCPSLRKVENTSWRVHHLAGSKNKGNNRMTRCRETDRSLFAARPLQT